MKKLPSKIFIDGGVPEETYQACQILMQKLGRPLDGQTTNPSLIAKNLKSRLGNGEPVRLTQDLALDEYKRIVSEMSNIIPKGSISIQVFANSKTNAQDMLSQARERIQWISNASIKFPCTLEGLKAAEIACLEMPINITLVFSQNQAGAVYEATKKAKHSVFISPFIGRLDDKGENGMQVVENILNLYKSGDGHVEVLTASVRRLDHISYALQLGSDIISIPFKIFKDWADGGFKQPDNNYKYSPEKLKEIPYREDIRLGGQWTEYDLTHDLTDKGLENFYTDWMGLFG